MIYGLEEKELKLIVSDYANSNDKPTPCPFFLLLDNRSRHITSIFHKNLHFTTLSKPLPNLPLQTIFANPVTFSPKNSLLYTGE